VLSGLDEVGGWSIGAKERRFGCGREEVGVGDAAEKSRIRNTPPGGCLFFFDISHSLDM
jgi:hypothetical protein